MVVLLRIIWVNLRECAVGIMLTEDLIRAKAREFCEPKNIPEAGRPKGSHGWIAKFKQSTGLRQWRFYGEWNSDQLAEHIDRIDEINTAWDSYSEGDRYNFDKTGIFCRMPRSIGLATQEAHGSKGDKTRVTYGCCVNASGTNKGEPLIIGHAGRPRCFGKRPASHCSYNFYYCNMDTCSSSCIHSVTMNFIGLSYDYFALLDWIWCPELFSDSGSQ